MKKVKNLFVALLVIFLLVGVLFACNDNDDMDSGNKQVPVYQRMTISSGMANFNNSPAFDNNHGNHSNNGNHTGWYKGDCVDREEGVDKENPFLDNEESENIENEIESSLKVEGATDDIYYASQNEDIYINIHIDNPDSFEILSFTLNEKKYSNYMFEQGSDMENIILKYNVGDTSGIREYTIDAIKYVDGTDIKDVIIDGNKTVRAGVKKDNQVQSIVSDLVVNTNSIAFNVVVNDPDNLVAFSNGTIKAILYDGIQIITNKDLIVGNNAVTFDGLNTNDLYQFAIVGCYDDLSGVGIKNNVLYKDAFYTKSVVLFSDVVVGQEHIAFDLNWHEDFIGYNLTNIKLYEGEVLLNEFDGNVVRIENLLSGKAYKIVANYNNNGREESISLEFKTQAKAMPAIEITNATSTQTSVAFAITEVDEDEVGEITKVELIHASGTKEGESVNVRAFENLLSNNDYTIKVVYTYDLNDGVGAQEIIKTQAVTTQAKAMPIVEVTGLTSTNDSISFGIKYTDVDNVGEIASIALYNDSVKVKETTLADVMTFDGLKQGEKYVISIAYKYNLNDGQGMQEAKQEEGYSTLVDSITIDEMVLLNNGVVRAGEEINLRVYFSNSAEIEMASIYVNGQKVDVVGGDRIESAIIKFVPNETGLCQFAVDRVDYTLNGFVVNQVVDSDVMVEYPVFADLDITYTPVTISPYENTGDGTYLTFDNSEGYSIYDINNGDYFIELGAGRFYTSANSISSIEYGYDNYGHTTQSIDYNSSYYSVGGIQKIYTVEELLAMTNGYYILMNDLDLRNVQITSQIALAGILDGNGHTIRGLSNVVDTSKASYFNLFKRGSIYDLTLKELYISVVSESNMTISPLGSVTLYNCVIKGDLVGSANVKYSGFNIAHNSTSVLVNVLEGNASRTITTTATSLITKNQRIVENELGRYFDCDGNRYLMKLWSRELENYSTEEDSVFAIRAGALEETAIQNLIIPARNVSNVNKSNIINLVLLDDNSKTSLGYRAFYNCSSLTSVVICNSVTSIGEWDFWCCSSLTSVVIPDSVTRIGDSAFYNCSSLTSVYYNGDETMWNSISIGCNNYDLTDATRYYYSATEPTESGNYWHYVDGIVTVW